MDEQKLVGGRAHFRKLTYSIDYRAYSAEAS